MADLDLEVWGAVAQLVLTAITFVGIVVSLYLSVRALREVQEDRKQRQKPHLSFDPGGFRVPVKFVKAGKTIPGVNPKYVASVFPHLPMDAESVRIKHRESSNGHEDPTSYGRLKNFGLGPALDTKVTWIPKAISFGDETFTIDDDKLQEPRYSHILNTMPPRQRHIVPGEIAKLTRLPTFVEKDIDKKITEVRGLLAIACTDVFGCVHIVKQAFSMFPRYLDTKPHVHVTFHNTDEQNT